MVITKRERLAWVLDRSGVLDLVLRAKRLGILSRRLALLTFHRVAEEDAPGFDPDVRDTTPAQLDAHLGLLKRHFTPVDTQDLEAARAGVPLPPNPLLLTFDDGYRDNFEHALPVLKKHGMKAVFFVTSGYVTERRLFWWERVSYLVEHARGRRLRLSYPMPLEYPLEGPGARARAKQALLRTIKDRPGLDLDRFLEEITAASGVAWHPALEHELADRILMTWEQIRGLREAGMDVQSHSRWHRVPHTLSPEDLYADLKASREQIEDEVKSEVRAVAYPTGKGVAGLKAHREAVERAGFRLGFTNLGGVARLDRETDWLNIPRIAMALEMSHSYFKGCLALGEMAY
jgi:peptidoglycan/xylan/chitin deacetylase (PgdA/CDA1 family)